VSWTVTQRLSRRPLLAILICRKIDNREAAVKRAREIRVDKHSFIIALDDNDLRALVDTVQKGADSVFEFLVDRFTQIAQ
jgi:protein-tyrosine-phosphatase